MQNIDIVIVGAVQAPTAQTLQTMIQEITKSEGTIGYITREPKHVDQRNVDPGRTTKLQFKFWANGQIYCPTHKVTVDLLDRNETTKEPKCKSPITKPATAESICGDDILSKARKIAETWKKEGKTKEELIREFGHMLDVLDAGKQ